MLTGKHGYPTNKVHTVGLKATWNAQRLIDNVIARQGADRSGTGTEGQANVLYLDGHVALMSFDVIIDPAIRLLAGDGPTDPTNLWGRGPE